MTARHPRDDFAALLGDLDDRTPLSDPDTLAQGEGERAQRRRRDAARRGRRRGLQLLAGFAALALVIVGAVWFGFGDRVAGYLGTDDFQGDGNGVQVPISVLDGDTGTSIGGRLEEAGIVKSADAFIREVLSHEVEPVFLPGTYALQEQMSSRSALAAITDQDNRLQTTVVLPEGYTQSEVFAEVEAAIGVPVGELEAAAADPSAYGLPAEAPSLEGFLFPATYEFEEGVDASGVITTMVQRMFQALDEAGVAAEDRWQVVRLASLVQKEARLDEDFYKVSRVFQNRIADGMLLQSDATVAYGSGNTHRVSTTDAERADASNLYNTYVHEGLVFAPISNPGELAIDAALHPAEGAWLYFVTWNLETGETIFSETIEEHEQGVQQWLEWMDEHPEYS